jgi:hypothetical protein
MDGAGVPYILQSEWIGHEVPGIRGVYSHVSLPMRTNNANLLRELSGRDI